MLRFAALFIKRGIIMDSMREYNRLQRRAMQNNEVRHTAMKPTADGCRKEGSEAVWQVNFKSIAGTLTWQSGM